MAAAALAAVAPSLCAARSNCTNPYATNYNPNCTASCVDDGSCVYPNDPGICTGNSPRDVAVRVKVTQSQREMAWAIDNHMVTPHRYGPFSHFGSGGAEMVLCMDGGSAKNGMDHEFEYRGGGEGYVEIEGLVSAACPEEGMESCVLMMEHFDPQEGNTNVDFHVGAVPPPPPIDPQVACSTKYVAAYVQFAPGEACEGPVCTPACQELITDVLRTCRNQTFQDGSPPACINDKGSAVHCELNAAETACKTSSPDCTYTAHGAARMFDEDAVVAFQKMGPKDCDYSLGYEVRVHRLSDLALTCHQLTSAHARCFSPRADM